MNEHEHLPCGVLTLSAEGRVLAINDTLVAILGMEREKVVGAPFTTLLSRGGQIFYQTHLFPLLRMRGRVEEIYLAVINGEGAEVPMLMNAQACKPSPDGAAYHAVLVRVLQRTQFEKALLDARNTAQKASKAKDDFLAALSHELRSPLNPILLLSADMELDPALPMTARQQAGVIRSNAELEAKLIDDLLDLTKIARGKLHLVPSVTDLHALLTLTEEIVRGECRTKGVMLHFAKEAADHHVNCDTARMQQILWNLIKNAIKFTPQHGSVKVRTHNVAPGRIAVTVQDTGIGIPADALPRIFDAFEQGSISKQKFGGLGLGLSITKSLVDLHEGTIAAESDGPGHGATFTIEFATTAPSPRKEAAPADLGGACLKVLLVEDHDPSREVLARILRRLGHEVHTARNGKEALLLAQTVDDLSVVISDIGLPDLSGLELMRQLKSLNPDLPGIAVSGYGMEQDMKNARLAGFAGHLVKPVSSAQLQNLVSQVVGDVRR